MFVEVFCICRSVLYFWKCLVFVEVFCNLWKCFVFVEVFCICASVLYLCKCFVFVEVFCICGSVL